MMPRILMVMGKNKLCTLDDYYVIHRFIRKPKSNKILSYEPVSENDLRRMLQITNSKKYKSKDKNEYRNEKDKKSKRIRIKSYLIDNSPEKILERRNRRLSASKERINKQRNERLKWDINYKIRCMLSSRLLSAIKNNQKSGRTIELLGCSIRYFKKYLEERFTEGMNWVNIGINGWHIDHIIPCNAFNLCLEEAQRFCFNYSNMQPLWGKENLQKQAKIDYDYLIKINIDPSILKERFRRKLLTIKQNREICPSI